MPQGKIKWVNEKRTYGFIEREDGTDVFVHFTAVEGDGFKSVNEGDAVQFEVSDGPKGPYGIKVKKLLTEKTL